MKIKVKTTHIEIYYENEYVDHDKQLEFIKQIIEKASQETIKIKQA